MQSEELSMHRLSGDEESGDEPLPVASSKKEVNKGGDADAAGADAAAGGSGAAASAATGAAAGAAAGASGSATGGAKRRRVMHVPNLGVGRPNQPNNPPARGRLPQGNAVVCLEVKEVISVEDGQEAGPLNELGFPSGSCIGYALVMNNPDEGAQVVEEFGYVPPEVEPEDSNNEESDSASGTSNPDDASAKPEPAKEDEKELMIEEIMNCIIAAYDKAVSLPDQK